MAEEESRAIARREDRKNRCIALNQGVRRRAEHSLSISSAEYAAKFASNAAAFTPFKA
jgi:hypothetical protein